MKCASARLNKQQCVCYPHFESQLEIFSNPSSCPVKNVNFDIPFLSESEYVCTHMNAKNREKEKGSGHFLWMSRKPTHSPLATRFFIHVCWEKLLYHLELPADGISESSEHKFFRNGRHHVYATATLQWAKQFLNRVKRRKSVQNCQNNIKLLHKVRFAIWKIPGQQMLLLKIGKNAVGAKWRPSYMGILD